jgi:hypothetical protein
LYAVCVRDTFYSLDVLDHGAFADQELIQVIHNNWPELIAHAACPEISGYTAFSKDARKQLSRNRTKGNALLLITVADGTVYMPPAGGLMTSGRNINVVTRANDLLTRVRQLETLARERADEIAEAITSNTGERVTQLNFRLDISSGKLLLVETNADTIVRFQSSQTNE